MIYFGGAHLQIEIKIGKTGASFGTTGNELYVGTGHADWDGEKRNLIYKICHSASLGLHGHVHARKNELYSR